MFAKHTKTTPPVDRPQPAPSRAKAAMPTLISSDLSIVGDLTGDADIQIEGRIEGNVKSRALTIGADGEVKGKIVAEEVQVSGTFEGQMSAGTVTLTRSAHVKGDITVREALSIETGARFEGQCKRVSAPEALHQPKFEGERKPAEGSGQRPGVSSAPSKTAAIR